MTFTNLLMCLTPLVAMGVMMVQTRFLMVLMSLESITLSTVMYVFWMYMNMNSYTPAITVLILTLGACEASIGLSLMVIMSRMCGNDKMKMC